MNLSWAEICFKGKWKVKGKNKKGRQRWGCGGCEKPGKEFGFSFMDYRVCWFSVLI